MPTSRMTRRSVIGAGSAALAWTITHPAGAALDPPHQAVLCLRD